MGVKELQNNHQLNEICCHSPPISIKAFLKSFADSRPGRYVIKKISSNYHPSCHNEKYCRRTTILMELHDTQHIQPLKKTYHVKAVAALANLTVLKTPLNISSPLQENNGTCARINCLRKSYRAQIIVKTLTPKIKKQ